MNNFTNTILIGVISGLIASGVMYFVLLRIKPRMRVSDKICQVPSTDLYVVKVVNLSRSILMDVEYAMHICHRSSDGIVQIEHIQFAKPDLNFLCAYSKSDKNAEYAIRLSFRFDIESLQTDEDYLVFTISAKHSVSGTAVFVSQKYKSSAIRCGRFETRESMTILLDEPTAKQRSNTIAERACV